MEELLNKLIEKGWKPYWIPRVKNVVLLNHYISFSKRTILWIEFFEYTLRSLVSKESGLWQFVCENKLYNPDNRWYWWKNVTIVWEYPTLDGDENIWYRDYEYYLIESALKDESELESFILDNIKV